MIVIEGIHCPQLECAYPAPERIGLDPGGTFVVAQCRRCGLEFKVRG